MKEVLGEGIIEEIVREFGLVAVFITMTLESALIPIPSEIVMPLAGFLASSGYFTLVEIILTASFANLLGSLIAYYFGFRIRPLLPEKFFKEHVEMAERFFERFGSRAVFAGRMLPAIRTFISLPAGLANIPLQEFALFTFLGSIPWNAGLAFLGFVLGRNWKLIHHYMSFLYLPLFLALGFLVFRKFLKNLGE